MGLLIQSAFLLLAACVAAALLPPWLGATLLAVAGLGCLVALLAPLVKLVLHR